MNTTKVRLHMIKLSGSYTIEAVFVVQIVLGLIFAMIYILFFLHDKAVLYGNMQFAVIETAEGAKEYKSNEEWKKDMQNNLWMFKVKSGKIKKNKIYIEASATAEANLEIPIIGYFISKEQEIEVEDKYLAIHPEYMLRVKDIFTDGDKE